MKLIRIKSLLLLIFVYLRLTFSGAGRNTIQTLENVDFQFLKEKKIHFTGNSAQYLKFDVKLPKLLDFAMCLWYKPDVILEHNILLSYGNNDQQLILWKIKKKLNVPMLILKICDKVVMEEKIEALTTGQWHHLCQYWQGSTGLWAFFLNSYIVSFGYKDTIKNSDWYVSSQNSTLTINHPRTKKSLYGEIYGFYMLSMNFAINNSEKLRSSDYKSLLIDLTDATKLAKSNKRKRQVETLDPMMNPGSRRPFFRIRNFFKFIRRVVSLVTVPIFRFAGRLIQPWRRRFITLRPTSPNNPTPVAATEIITNFQLAVENATVKNETVSQQNVTKMNHSDISINKLEESIVIYEVENEPELMESRQLRNVLNDTKRNNSTDSSEIYLQSSETGTQKAVEDKCTLIENKFNENYKKSNFSEEPSKDAITQLGVNLLFTQLSYTCCSFANDKLLISWDDTPVLVNNVVMDTAAGCGSF